VLFGQDKPVRYPYGGSSESRGAAR
jgi:hypothetical protein